MCVRGRHLGNASFELTLYGCLVSVCCVGFASLDVVCDGLYDCVWNVGLYQLSELCVYFYCYSDYLRRGSIC